MGCWNATCGMSQLPIHGNDKVKLVLLKKSLFSERAYNGNGFCYSTDLFTPLYLPLEGYYDSYGCIENIEDPESKHLNFLNTKLFLQEPFENLKSLIDSISHGEVEDLTFVLIHSDIFNASVNLVKNNIVGWGDTAQPQKKFLTAFIKRYLALDDDPMISDALSPVDDLYGRKLPFLIRSSFYLGQLSIFSINELLEFLLYQDCLETGRKFWSPQSSAGSQATDFEVAKMIGKFTKEKERKYKDYINS